MHQTFVYVTANSKKQYFSLQKESEVAQKMKCSLGIMAERKGREGPEIDNFKSDMVVLNPR